MCRWSLDVCCATQVTRAEALLRNLEQERDRWSMSSESFTKQLESLIGDGLLAAAFVTYVGVFDYRTRKVRARCGEPVSPHVFGTIIGHSRDVNAMGQQGLQA